MALLSHRREGSCAPEREPIPSGARAWRAATGYAAAHVAPARTCTCDACNRECQYSDQSVGYWMPAASATLRSAASPRTHSERMPMCNLRFRPSRASIARMGMRTSVRSPSLSASSRDSCVSMYTPGVQRVLHPRHPSPACTSRPSAPAALDALMSHASPPLPGWLWRAISVLRMITSKSIISQSSAVIQ